jgi:hypothetical protein
MPCNTRRCAVAGAAVGSEDAAGEGGADSAGEGAARGVQVGQVAEESRSYPVCPAPRGPGASHLPRESCLRPIRGRRTRVWAFRGCLRRADARVRRCMRWRAAGGCWKKDAGACVTRMGGRTFGRWMPGRECAGGKGLRVREGYQSGCCWITRALGRRPVFCCGKNGRAQGGYRVDPTPSKTHDNATTKRPGSARSFRGRGVDESGARRPSILNTSGSRLSPRIGQQRRMTLTPGS